MRARTPTPDGLRNGSLAGHLIRLGTPVPWAIAALSLVLVAAVALGGLALRQRIVADAERELAAVTEAVAAAADLKLSAHNAALKRIGLQLSWLGLREPEGASRLDGLLEVEHDTAVSMLALVIVAADGTIVASSRAAFGEHGRAHAGAWSNLPALSQTLGDQAVIGPRIIGTFAATDGRPVVVMSRPLRDGWEFAGVIEAVLSLDEANGLLRVPPLGDGTIVSLRHEHGGLLKRIGAAAQPAAGQGVVATAALPHYGLLVVAERPLAEVLAAWRASVQRIGAVTLLLCLAGLAVALLARWATRRQATLAAAIEQQGAHANAIADANDAVLWSAEAATGALLHLSPSVERLTGHPVRAFTAAPGAWLSFVHPEDRARVRAAFANRPDALTLEYRMITAGGGEIVLRDTSRAVRDAAGTLLRHDGMAIDVTRERRTEAALDEARRIARLGVWQIDLPEQRLVWSPEIYRIFGLDPRGAEITLEAALAHVHPDDVAMVRARLDDAIGGRQADFVCRITRADGSQGWVWSETRITRDTAGAVTRISGTCQDITERNRSEERLARSAQLAALGELTGGIAHDFNNLLAVIRLNLDLIAAEVAAPSVRECTASALAAAERGARLTAQLLAFARRQPMRPATIHLACSLAAVTRMLERLLGPGVTLAVIPPAADLAVSADPAQFDSALMNLALNARDAMPSGGTITVEAAPAPLTPEEQAGLGLATADCVAITVADDGTGMTADVLARACEPFFTTKGSSKGTGLGLAMVYGFVRQSGGELRIESEPGRGTRVTLWLPRAAHAAAAVSTAAAQTRPLAGSVLLVEDETGLRDAAARILRGAGLAVHEAGTAEEALALLDDLAAPPDLLLSDVMLGCGMDGFGLAAAMRARLPGIAVLLASGYAARGATEGGAAGRETVLRKPYGAPALLAAVAASLDRGTTPLAA